MRWATLEERDTVGFSVWCSPDASGAGAALVGGFVEAHGPCAGYEVETRSPAAARAATCYVLEHTSAGIGDRSSVVPVREPARPASGKRTQSSRCGPDTVGEPCA